MRFGYEKAGLVVWDEPIPWNAEAVLLEARARFPTSGGGFKSDFHLEVPGQPPVPAVTLNCVRPEDGVNLRFRLPALQKATRVKLFWRSFVLEQLDVPFLSAEQFLGGLQLRMPAVFAQVGRFHLPCRTVVEGQCHGLMACGLLSSPTTLLPAMDLKCTIEIADVLTNQSRVVPVQLTRSQLAARQSLLSSPPLEGPFLEGVKSVQWCLAGRSLARHEVQVITPLAFQQTLYLAQSYFLYRDTSGGLGSSRFPPVTQEVCGVAPCFLVASRAPAVAASCQLQLRTHYKGPARRPTNQELEVLVTDGPVPCTAPVADLDHYPQIAAFELLSGGRSLGMLPLGARQIAHFTSEGGFDGTEEYSWTDAHEEELVEHLRHLMAVPPN